MAPPKRRHASHMVYRGYDILIVTIVIAVGSSAIDFAALTRPAVSHESHLSKREVNAGGIVLIIIMVLTAVSIIFCVIVGMIICKNKAQAKKRQQRMEASRKVDNQGTYTVLEDMEPGGIQEMPTNRAVKAGVELEGTINEVPRLQQLDGFTAPV